MPDTCRSTQLTMPPKKPGSSAEACAFLLALSCAIAAVSRIAAAATHVSGKEAALRPLKFLEIRLLPMTGQIDFRDAALRHCPTAFAPANFLRRTGGKNEERRFV